MKLFSFYKEIKNFLLIKKLSKFGLKEAIINEDGSISFIGHVNLSNKNLKKIPFNFKNVHGDFDCSNNQLSDLVNVPETVGGNFYCANNQLTNLKNSPKEVKGSFCCSSNKLKTLEYCPSNIYRLIAEDNYINTLEHFPEIVRGSCYLRKNDINSIETLKTSDIRGDITIGTRKDSENKTINFLTNIELKKQLEMRDLDLALSKKTTINHKKLKI